MSERHWKQKFREEADDVWFKDIDFHEQLKSRIRNRIAEENIERPPLHLVTARPDLRADIGSDVHSDPHAGRSVRKSRTGWRRKIYGGVAAAFLVLGTALSATLLFDGQDDKGGMMAIETAGPDGAVEVMPLDMLSANDGQMPADSKDMTLASALELDNIHEARSRFGDDLILPGYMPAGYEIVRITVWADSAKELEAEGSAAKLEIEYASGEGRIRLIERRLPEPDKEIVEGQRIEADGMTLYIRRMDGEIALSRLIGGLELTIVATLEQDELIRIARSFTNER